MKKIITNNGIIYYNEILKKFYYKFGLGFYLFTDKRVILSLYVQNQVKA